MKILRRPTAMPRQSEWDFRSLTQEEARRVVRYEYAREDVRFCDEVIAWQRTPFSECCGLNFPPWGGPQSEVQQLFQSERIIDVLMKNNFFSDLPKGASSAIMANTPKLVYSALGALAWWFPEFPTPYLEVKTQAMRKERIKDVHTNGEQLKAGIRWADKAVWILEGPKYGRTAIITPELFREELEEGSLYLRVNFQFGMQRVLKEMRALGSSLPRSVVGTRTKQGVAASPEAPFKKLKWLATYRLDKAGLSHDYVNELCNDLIRRSPNGDAHGVLPRWDKDRTRWKAIRKFENHMATLLNGQRVHPLCEYEFTGTPPDLW